MKQFKLEKTIMIVGVLAAASAHAEDKFTVNGFGFQDYRQSNANKYEGADRRGTWDNGILALVMSAKLSDRDTVWAQLESKPTEPTTFTWAYLDHRFNDNLTARIGRIKFPQGFYNEFIDNKAMQLSAIRPSAYAYGTADMVHDAYSGVGIDLTSGSLFTQVYGGVIYTPANNAAATDNFNDRRMIGTRITWNTPLEGLHFMFTGIEAQVEDNNAVTKKPPLGQLGRETRLMWSVEYVTDRIDIKSEHNTHRTPFQAGDPLALPAIPDTPSNTTTGWYVQGGYKIDQWTPYVRFDYFVADQSIASDPSSYQKDWVIGVNYKINENVNARIEDHIIHGYGLTVAGGEVAAGLGKTNWNMMAAEVNFMF